MNNVNNDREALLQDIGELSFAVLEMNLYLDGHPDNKEALKDYRKAVEELTRITEMYEEEFGPLTAMGDGYADEFLWSRQPWPWQMGG